MLTALALAAGLASAQVSNSSAAFWDLPRARTDAFLQQMPPDNAGRYARLRELFIGYGCTGERMREQPLKERADRRAEKEGKAGRSNLICTLPGRYERTIVVAAWYPARSLYEGASTAWPEAVMLPMLYHALQAQPRHFTFVLAALSGDEGQRLFLEQVLNRKAPPLVALVGLDGLGVGAPQFTVASSKHMKGEARAATEVLEKAGLLAVRFASQKNEEAAPPSGTEDRSIFPNSLLEETRELPRALLYSGPGPTVTPEAFHRQLDFAAAYLSAIDLRLDPLAETAPERLPGIDGR